MTDGRLTANAATQTATPRITHYFFQVYKDQLAGRNTECIDIDLTEGENKLIQQRKALREIDQRLTQKCFQRPKDQIEDEVSDDSLSESNKHAEAISADVFPTLWKSTMASWQFDVSDDEELSTLPRRIATETDRPWKSAHDIVIGSKLSNMKLSPLSARKSIIKKKNNAWPDAQQNAIGDLLHQANALLDVFDQMAIILGPDLKLNDLPKIEDTNIQFLSEYWEPIMEKSQKSLDEKIRNLKHLPSKKVEHVKPELFGNALN